MAEEDVSIRLTNVENEMKLVLNVTINLTKQVESIHGKLTHMLASIEVVLLHLAVGNDQATASNDKIPMIKEDPLPLAIEEVKLVSALMTEHDKCLVKVEKMLKQLQGPQHSIPLNLSVYKRIKIVEKFKMLEFEKYNGTSCPRHHLHMYYVRMTQYVNNEPLMIQTFQASLTEPALTWHMSKDVDAFKSLDDVADIFLKQYQFNLDVTFSHDDLECTEKTKSESFKKYATRWRNLVAQVTPELSDHEQMKLFIKSLPHECRHRLIGATAKSLKKLVSVGERIKMGLHKGWFTDPTSKSNKLGMKKENELIADMDFTYTQTIHPPPIVQMSGGQQSASDHHPPQKQSNKKQFTPLLESPFQVLAILQKKSLLSIEPIRHNPENFSNSDSFKKCDYHISEVGYSTNECYTLKRQIQSLLDKKLSHSRLVEEMSTSPFE